MKKFTFLASLLMMFCAMTANAELMDKFFYKISTESVEGWTLQDAGRMTLAPGKDYLSVTLTNNGGRMINRFWNEEGWAKVQDLSTLPEDTYKFSFDLKQTVNATRTDMEFVLLPVNACSATDSRVSSHNYHWFNNEGEDYFFRYRVYESTAESFKIIINENPTARGDWPKPGTEAAADADSTVLNVGVKYSFGVEINVAAKTATYTITAEDGSVVKTGVHKYVCEENRAGIWIMSANSANSVMQLSNMGLSFKKEGPFATEPAQELFWVEGAERDFMATFSEGEVLHWIQLGDADDVVSGNTYEDGKEYQVTYDEAHDAKTFEEGEDYGRKIITCNASGTLKMWTSMEADDTNVSDDVLVEVVCETIKFPAPTVAITNVKEGYAKEYTVTVDNSGVLLKPVITIHYKMGEEEGDILSGTVLPMNAAGTIELYSWDQTHPDEFYDRSDVVTVENNAEYVVAAEKNYAISKAEAQETMAGFTATTLNNFGNSSHWERIYSDQKYGYKEDGTAEAYDEAHEAEYVYVKEGFNYFPGTAIGTDQDIVPVQQVNTDAFTSAVAPLVITANEKTDATWYLFPQEGLVSYQTGLTNVPINVSSKYTSDDATKPNFYILHLRGGYDRPDKGDCNKTAVVVAGEEYLLYRYDTAICDVKVMTYKGFNPGTGINNIAASTVANSAKVVKSIVNGKLVIVKDGKQFNVAGQRM